MKCAYLQYIYYSSGENYGSDFSVSTRLLSNPSPSAEPVTRPAYGSQSSVAVYDTASVQPPPTAWQLLLPSDQGTVDQSVGYQPVPNMSLLTHSTYTQPHPAAYSYAHNTYPLRAPPSYSAAVQQQQNVYYPGGQTSPYLRQNSEGSSVFPALKSEQRQGNTAPQYTQDWRSSDMYSNGSTGTSKSITPSPTAEGTFSSGNAEKDVTAEDAVTTGVKIPASIDSENKG